MSRKTQSFYQQMDHANTGDETWDWQDDIRLQSDSPLDISHCLFDELNQNGQDSWYMFDETTPIKDYDGFDCLVSSVTSEVVIDKGMEDCRDSSSQSKRRRMLQFHSSEVDACVSDWKISSGSVKSEEESAIERNGDLYFSNMVPEEQPWASIISEEHCSSGSECVAPSPEGWMVDYFNERELHRSSNDINLSTASEEQFDVSEFCNLPPEMEMDGWQQFTPQAPCTYFAGATSFIKTPTKALNPVVYPFTLIKPCEMQGDVTLNDINRRILAPLASKSKQKKNKDASSSYPTSAFSGKPVVALTKIHTEGGKGSITIMRTKG